MRRKARLKSYQKVRWAQIVVENEKFNLGSTDQTHKKYAASATIKKLVGSKKNFGSENRTQKTIHRHPQPRNGGLKEKFGVRKSDSKNIHRRPQPMHKWWTERKIWGPKIGLKNKNNSA